MLASLGVGLMFVSAFVLIITFATDSIPANWPLEPQHREDNPGGFRTHVLIWLSFGIVGGALLLVDLL